MKESNTLFAIYGAGGSGLSLSFFIKSNSHYSDKLNNIYFIDDDQSQISKRFVNNFPIISYTDFKSLSSSNKKILISINDVNIKSKIYEKIINDKISLWNYIDNNSIIDDSNLSPNSSYFAPFTIVNNYTEIGHCFSCNIYSYVEHESKVGNFVTFAPGVKCNGNVVIEDNVYIGSGVIINNGNVDKKIIIGKNSFVSAGTIINKSVPQNSRIIGSQRTKNVT